MKKNTATRRFLAQRLTAVLLIPLGMWFIIALIWQKVAGRSPAPAALKSETPEGEPAALGFGVQVPFGPMLAIAAVLYFLVFRGFVDAWFAQFGELF